MNVNDSLKIMFGGDKKYQAKFHNGLIEIATFSHYYYELPLNSHTQRDENILLSAYSAYLFDKIVRDRKKGQEKKRCLTFISNIFVFCQLKLQCPCHIATHTQLLQILFTATEDPLVIVSRITRVSSEIKCLIKWHDYLLSFICRYISVVSLRFCFSMIRFLFWHCWRCLCCCYCYCCCFCSKKNCAGPLTFQSLIILMCFVMWYIFLSYCFVIRSHAQICPSKPFVLISNSISLTSWRCWTYFFFHSISIVNSNRKILHSSTAVAVEIFVVYG